MNISVVIPTCNRKDLLAAALDSLTRQTVKGDGYEVLVIDNGSRDATAEVVKAFSLRLQNLRHFFSPDPGLHVGRHRGLRESKGEVLVFADDDIVALPNWLASIQEAFNDAEVAMAGGNNLPLFLESPPDWLKLLWEMPTSEGGRALGALSLLELPGGIRRLDPFHVWGCNFAIRKTVLLSAGGFNPDSMPGDLVRFRGDGETAVSRYVARRGLKCLFHPGASVYHKVTPDRMTFAYFHQRGFNQGVSDSFTILRDRYLYGHLFDAGKASFKRRIRQTYHRLAGYRVGDAEAEHALRELDNGHAEGYAYHQRLFKTDSEVRAWVLRENYL